MHIFSCYSQFLSRLHGLSGYVLVPTRFVSLKIKSLNRIPCLGTGGNRFISNAMIFGPVLQSCEKGRLFWQGGGSLSLHTHRLNCHFILIGSVICSKV